MISTCVYSQSEFINNRNQGQINFCDQCGNYDNESSDTYSDILSIELKGYKGSPIFNDLDENAKQKLLEEHTYSEYDKNGNVLEFKDYEYLVGSNTFKFEYNENGKVKSLINNQGSTEHKETFSYKDNLITNYVFKYDGVEVDRIIKFKINDQNLVINRKEFFGNGNLYKDDNYKFDLKGNEIFSDSYGVKTTTTYKYDSAGRILRKKSVNNYKKGFQTDFRYNETGNLIERKITNVNGKLFSKTTYEYKSDLMIKSVELNYSGGKVYSSEIKEYDFNNNENWIKEVTFRNDILTSIREREISYRNE